MTRPNDTVLEILRAVVDEYDRQIAAGEPSERDRTFPELAYELNGRVRTIDRLANEIYFGTRSADAPSTDLIGELRGELIGLGAEIVEFVGLIDVATAGFNASTAASRKLRVRRPDPEKQS
jgi:hypothetical protein